MAEQTNIFYQNEQSIYGYPNIITLGIGVYAPGNREFFRRAVNECQPERIFRCHGGL